MSPLQEPESHASESDLGTVSVSEDVEHGLGAPLLDAEEPNGMTRAQAINLYTSHFLSTWNVRTYEFAAIIFTAAAYPETLMAASTRGIVRTLASICFSSVVGRWVDHNPKRLHTLISTITLNRITVIVASALWFFIVVPPQASTNPNTFGLPSFDTILTHPLLRGLVFALILALGIIENLSASANMLSMERDWVIVASGPAGHPYDLTHLNAVLRRIDLICKLIAPILISVIVSSTGIKNGVVAVAGMSAFSWTLEIFCAKRVWKFNPALQRLKQTDNTASNIEDANATSPLMKLLLGMRRYARDFKNYFKSKVCVPSLSLAFLHISSLSYGATFITFLLATGFSLDLITLARAAGSVVEISSTVVTPFGVHYLGRAKNHGRFRGEEIERRLMDGEGNEDEDDDVEGRTETGLERLGLWGLMWQLVNLAPVVFALWSLTPQNSPPLPTTNIPLAALIFPKSSSQTLLSITLFTFLSFSRLGLWIYDLTTQQLTQTLTPATQRSSFTGVEYSFVSIFELMQHIVTIIFHKPEQFKWISMMSWTCVGISTVAYAGWVWRMRGHLVHWDKMRGRCGKGRRG